MWKPPPTGKKKGWDKIGFLGMKREKVKKGNTMEPGWQSLKKRVGVEGIWNILKQGRCPAGDMGKLKEETVDVQKEREENFSRRRVRGGGFWAPKNKV